MKMGLMVFAAIIGFSYCEFRLLLWAGENWGFAWVLALCVLSAVLGTRLVRLVGGDSLQRLQGTLARGETPTAEVAGGLLLFLASFLFFLPGFLSDGLALLLLVRPIRLALARSLLRSLQKRMMVFGQSRAGAGFATWTHFGSWSGNQRPQENGTHHSQQVIDVEVEERGALPHGQGS